jgi:HSP20 family molecular chaperone IbpA
MANSRGPSVYPADLKNGVLTIRIPKRPEAGPRKISLVSPAESPMINA